MKMLCKHSVFLIFISLILWATLLCAETPIPKNRWELALQNLEKSVAPSIEKSGKITKDRNVSLVQFQSGLLSKYFPKCRLYVIDSGLLSIDRIFLLEETGAFHNLGFGHWESIDAKGSVFHLPALCNYLISQKIKIENKETAIEFAKLLEEISGAPDEVRRLRLNTNNYTLYKKDFFQQIFRSHLHWEYFAEKTKNGYKASRKYIGPPASILTPMIFNLELNKKNEVIKITATI